MFANLSNLKDKLNTSLQNINQAGYIAPSSPTASPPGGDLSPSSSPPISPSSSPRTARRIAPSPLAVNELSAGQSATTPVSVDGESNLPPQIEEKLQKLARYESRFPELAKAYKHLLKQYKAAEGVLKAEAPNVDGLADSDALQAHLRNMNMKSQFAMEEIKRLTEALNGQKQQLEELRSIHSDASKSQADMLYSLKTEVERKEKEIEELKETKTRFRSREPSTSEGAIVAEQGLDDPLGATSKPSPRSRSHSPARKKISTPRSAPSSLMPMESDTQTAALVQTELQDAQNTARDCTLQISNLIAENNALKAELEDRSDRKVEHAVPEKDMDGNHQMMNGKSTQHLADEAEEAAMTFGNDLEMKIQEAQKAVENSESKCAELELQMKVLSARNDELIAEISKATGRGDGLDQSVSHLIDQIESQMEKEEGVQSDAENELKAESDEIQGDTAARLQSLCRSIGRMTQEKARLVEKLNELTAETRRREAEQEETKNVQDLQNAVLELLRTDMKEKVEENDDLLKKLKASHQNIKMSSERIVDLESRVRTMSDSMQQHDIEMRRAQEELDTSSEKIKAMESQVQVLTGSIQQKDSQMLLAKEESENFMTKLQHDAKTALEHELRLHEEAKARELEQAREEWEGNLMKMTEECGVLREKSSRLEQRIREAEKREQDLITRVPAESRTAQPGSTGDQMASPDVQIIPAAGNTMIEHLTDQITMLRTRIYEFEVETESLRSQISERDSAKAEIEGRLNTKQNEIDELNVQVKRLETVIDEGSERTKSSRTEMEANTEERNALEEQVKTLKATVEELGGQLETLEKEKKELGDKLEKTNALEEQVKALTANAGELEGQLETLEKEKNELGDKLAKMNALEEQVVALTANVGELGGQLETLGKEKNELSDKLAKTSEENGSMEGRLRNLLEVHQLAEEKLTAVQCEKEEVTEKVKLLEKTNEELEERVKVIFADKQVPELEKAGLEDKLKPVEDLHADAIKEIRKEKEKLENDLKDMEVRLAESEAVLRKAREELKNIQNELGQKEVMVAETKEETTKLKLEHEALVTERNQAKSELETLREQMSNDRKAQNELQKELDKATSTAAKLTGEIQNEKSTVHNLQKSEKELREKIDKAIKEKDRLASLNAENAQKIKTLESSITEKDESLTTLQLELEQKIGIVENLRSQQTEDEEAKNKSVVLLKKSRKHHLKLEKERDDALSELAQVKPKLVELETSHSTLLSSLTTLREQQNAREQEYKENLNNRERQLSEVTRRFNDFQAQTQRVSSERAELTETLALKQAEFESSQQALEEFRFRESEARRNAIEATERAGVLEEELQTSKALFERIAKQTDELRGKLSESEQAVVKAESRSRDAERKVTEWESSHQQVLQKLERKVEALKSNIVELTNQKEGYAKEVQTLKEECNMNQAGKDEARNRQEELKEKLKVVEQQLAEAIAKSSNLRELEQAIEKANEENEQVLEENRMREGHLRAMNKTLKDEIRKLQKQSSSSSVQPSQPLASSSGGPTSPTSPPVSRRRSSSPRSGFAGVRKRLSIEDAGVNVAYLKHVVLKFVEMKDQRPQLLSVLGTILDFSPEELRRVSRKI